MDRKKPKSKLRKEDIGTPVNFVHIQHVGKNGHRNAQGSISASASPTSTQCDPFFDANFRCSDSSIRDHRLSSVVQRRPSNPPPLPPHGSSMSDLSLINKNPEGRFDPRNSSNAPEKPLPQKPLKASFTGSLLNLSFLQFGKSTGADKSRNGDNMNGSHRNEPMKGKRLSLGMFNTSNAVPSSFPAPMRPIPDLPSPSPPPFAQINRRRSSSFSGTRDFRFSDGAALEADVNSGRHSVPLSSSSSTEHRSQFSFEHVTPSGCSKKLKLQRTPSQVTPPMSPSYDELPPPPPFDEEDVDMPYSRRDTGQEIKPLPMPMATLGDVPYMMLLPESPTYEELPPPPQFDLNVPPNYKSLSRSGSADPVKLRKNKVPAPCMPNRHKHIKDLALSSGEKVGISDLEEVTFNILQVADLRTQVTGNETSSCGTSTFKTANAKLPAWRSKVVRVNAPTLPPLCVPFIQGHQGVDSSPEVWPLQPAPYVISQFTSDGQKPDRPGSDEPVYAVPIKSTDPLRMPNLELTVEATHLKPLSKIFQKKVAYKDWPFVMEYLLTSASSASNEPPRPSDIDRIYGQVIENTLELWLKLHGNQSPTFQEVILAFEHVQNSSVLPSEFPPTTEAESTFL